MIRVILGLKRAQHIIMRKVREKIKMLSVNQMSLYHTIILEAYNITKNKSFEQLHLKFMHEGKHYERSKANNDLKVRMSTMKPKLF